MQDFQLIIKNKLASRIVSGDIPKPEEVKNISDETLMGTLDIVTKTNVKSKNLKFFLDNIKKIGRLKSVIKSIVKRNGNI